MTTALHSPPTPVVVRSDPYLYRNGYWQFDYHEGQWEAMAARERFILISAGTQSGKTACLPWWLLSEIKERGPGDYLFATPTFTLLEKKALPEFLRLFHTKLGFGDYVGGSKRTFTLNARAEAALFGKKQKEPSRVVFGHAQDPDSLESATYKGAVLDEAGQKKFKHGSWEAVQRRLSIHEGRCLIGTTPYYIGWLKRELHDRAGDGTVRLVQFASTMNPAFPREEYDRMRAIMPRWKFDMMYRGLFRRPAGMIYDCWSDKNTMPRFPLPPTWPRHLGLDFGGVNTAGVFLAEEQTDDGESTGRYIAYRTYHEGSRTTKEHAKALRRGEVMTPAATGGAWSEDQWRREFRDAGLPVRRPPIREVEEGIGRVYALMKTRRLLVFDDLHDLIDDIESYSRVLGDDDEPTEKIEDKEKFHLADGLRYKCCQLAHPTAKAEGFTAHL